MKHIGVILPAILSAVALFALTTMEVHAESCIGGGVPGLNAVATRLKVRPLTSSMSALNACDGRSYEIGRLLNAALDRMDRYEKRINKLEGK